MLSISPKSLLLNPLFSQIPVNVYESLSIIFPRVGKWRYLFGSSKVWNVLWTEVQYRKNKCFLFDRYLILSLKNPFRNVSFHVFLFDILFLLTLSKMETTQKYRHRTISGILWNKFLDTLHESSWYDIFLTLAKCFCWLVISLSLINIPASIENLSIALKWHDFAILKILVSFIGIFCAPLLISSGKKVLEWIKNNIPELPKTPVHGPSYM